MNTRYFLLALIITWPLSFSWGQKLSWNAADKDGDGIVSLKEARRANWPLRLVQKEDKNRDGFVSKKEYKNIKKRMKRAVRSLEKGSFELMDVSGDKKISSVEWWGSEKAFSKADLNADGDISVDEAERVRSASIEKSKLQKEFKSFDVDGNGQLTREEWSSVSDFDSNGDGVISKKEFIEGQSKK